MGMEKSRSGGDAAGDSEIDTVSMGAMGCRACQKIHHQRLRRTLFHGAWLFKEKAVTAVCSMGTAFLGG